MSSNFFLKASKRKPPSRVDEEDIPLEPPLGDDLSPLMEELGGEDGVGEKPLLPGDLSDGLKEGGIHRTERGGSRWGIELK